MIVHEIARDLEIEEIMWRLAVCAEDREDLNGAEFTGFVREYSTKFSRPLKTAKLTHLCFDFEIRTTDDGVTIRKLSGDRTAFVAWCLTLPDDIEIDDLLPHCWFDLIADPEEVLLARSVAAMWDQVVITLPGGVTLAA